MMKFFSKATLYEIFTPSDPGGPGTPGVPGVRRDPGGSRGAPGSLLRPIGTDMQNSRFFIISTPGDIYDKSMPKASSQNHENPENRESRIFHKKYMFD